MLFGSRLFVAVVFIIIGLAFWATTAQLYLEFAHGTNLWTLDKPVDILASLENYERQPWFLLLTHYSDLFVFFPVFGTIALIAFFVPAAVLVDVYWNSARQARDPIPFSQLRFVIGLAFLIAASLGLGWYTSGGSERTLWQLDPAVLKADKGVGCVAGRSCDRVGFLDALHNVRVVSRERITLADLKRSCRRDWYVQATGEEARAPRYCPVTTNIRKNGSELDGLWTTNETCCNAQQLFDTAVKASFAPERNRSDTNTFQEWLWPFHVFFLLTLVAISLLLATRRKRIENLYPDYSRAIDRGVLIGLVTMVTLPLMHNGFLLTTNLLHGEGASISFHRIPETFTALFAVWAVIVIVSFLHPANAQAEPFSRIMGVIASLVFALKGDVVTDYVIRLVGAGAGLPSIALMFGVAAVLLLALVIWKKVSAKPDMPGKAADAKTPQRESPHTGE